jgi:ATP-binding cassette subfamily B protein
MTHDLVERMVGQRTRLAQEAPSRRHAGEDQALASYLEHARAMDRIGPILIALVPKSWLLAGVLSVAPLFVGEVSASAALPAALGGVLLARLAFEKLMLSVASLSRAAIAWKQIRPLFLAAARAELAGAPAAVASALSPETSTGPLLSAHELAFRHRGRSAPVLEGVSLSIARNDRLLLQGPSGGGKSTLASLLSGMRAPDSGLILLGGLDRHTLGEAGWRKRIAHAPQFHENHVFAASFAFNLLMGGRWPAPPRRVAEAEAICRELGLGPLLERMPGGMLQVVGDTGWQLSHGERSRLFIARALLQRAEVLVLDESFAALDPENLRESLKTVLARAPAMVVIAHP